jgi:hypothetical protein
MEENIHRLRNADSIHTLDEPEDNERSATATVNPFVNQIPSGTIRSSDSLVYQICDTTTMKHPSPIQHVYNFQLETDPAR